MRKLLKNDGLSKWEKANLITRLVSPFPLCIYALFLGMTGLTLTAISILGLGIYPALSPEVLRLIKYTMLVGFILFLAQPVGIYLWSIERDYVRTKDFRDILTNVFIILVTTIPFFIVATIPVIHAWTNPLSGWGSKTPRSEERMGLIEEEYLKISKKSRVRTPRRML